MTPQDFLSQSEAVSRLSYLDARCGVKISLWHNFGRDITYSSPKGHTFSYYLSGGHRSVRKKVHSCAGGPGKICLIPEGADSEWGHGSPLKFLHIHVDDTELRRRYVEITDRDARLCDIPEITYGEYPRIRHAFDSIFAAWSSDDRLAVECALSDLFGEIIGISKPGRDLHLTGGLSAYISRRIQHFIDDNLDKSLTLEKLASIAELSEFHFQKMFLKSFAISPSRWVFHRRIRKAEDLLTGHYPISDIAVRCGFSDQSHLTRSFRKATGTTPAVYRRLIQNSH